MTLLGPKAIKYIKDFYPEWAAMMHQTIAKADRDARVEAEYIIRYLVKKALDEQRAKELKEVRRARPLVNGHATNRSWNDKEDGIITIPGMKIREMMLQLPHRTYQAIAQRRAVIRATKD